MKKLPIRRLLWGLSLSLLMLEAKSITLTAEQKQDWQIKTQVPKVSTSLPLGEFMAEVVTPPQRLNTITLPFEAQIRKLHIASYDSVKKGQLLAEVSGKDWISIQQKLIEERIELKHYEQVLSRKNRLCREEIIPKKECASAKATYQAYKSKVSGSKALLRAYGASEKMINNISNNLQISQTIPIYSKVNGRLLALDIQSGKSTMPSDVLFTILKEGELWLEMEMLVQKAMRLTKGQKVEVAFNGEVFVSTLLLHAPTINPENQTQKVRFSLPNSTKFLSGMGSPASIMGTQNSVKVAKKSVINIDGKNVVFLKKESICEALVVEVVGEEGMNYYLKEMPELHAPIATSSLLILKSLMEGEDE